MYLANGFLFVGSTSGDSQLVRLPDGFVEEPSNEGDGTGDMEVDQSPKSAKLDVVSSFTSLAPIVDFRVVEDEVQGQVRCILSICLLAYVSDNQRAFRQPELCGDVLGEERGRVASYSSPWRGP